MRPDFTTGSRKKQKSIVICTCKLITLKKGANMTILVTGGAGYVGSHTCVQLLAEGHEIVVVDNLVNSKETAVKYIKGISGRDFNFYNYDLKNMDLVEEIFDKEKIDSVIHFAGYKAVRESVEDPIMYY